MTKNPPPKQLLWPAIAAHLVVTAIVWRDIGRRAPAELRGSKAFWRVFTGLNTGNSLIYLLLGRRR
jgi:hypothetical protein